MPGRSWLWGWTQQQIADALKVPRQTVGYWLSILGKGTNDNLGKHSLNANNDTRGSYRVFESRMMTLATTEQPNLKYQLLPPLSDEEYTALKDDIKEHGILIPIELDEHGYILDGHHRLRAWHELRNEGIKVPDYERLVRVGLSEEEKRNHIRVLNIVRRHLTKQQLDDQMIAMRQDGMTLQAIADVAQVDKETVRGATKPTFENSKVQTIVGKDGKSRPAKYKPRKTKTVLAITKRDKVQTLPRPVGKGERTEAQ